MEKEKYQSYNIGHFKPHNTTRSRQKIIFIAIPTTLLRDYKLFFDR